MLHNLEGQYDHAGLAEIVTLQNWGKETTRGISAATFYSSFYWMFYFSSTTRHLVKELILHFLSSEQEDLI